MNRYLYQNDKENERNNLVPHLTRYEPLRVMAIFGTYLRAGRGSEPVWFRGPKTSPKVPVIYRDIYGASSSGSNPKLMMTLKKACPPPWGLKDPTTQTNHHTLFLLAMLLVLIRVQVPTQAHFLRKSLKINTSHTTH